MDGRGDSRKRKYLFKDRHDSLHRLGSCALPLKIWLVVGMLTRIFRIPRLVTSVVGIPWRTLAPRKHHAKIG